MISSFLYFAAPSSSRFFSCVSLQNATRRHVYLNSFSTTPQSAQYGINQFSDLSQKEFRSMLNFCNLPLSLQKYVSMFCIWTIILLLKSGQQAELIILSILPFSIDLYLKASADRAPHFPGLKTKQLPAKFDWRDKAAVAPVQNQGTVRFTRINEEY